MQIIKTVAELQAALGPLRQKCGKIGFVPTMGHLHEGHLSLMRNVRATTECVVVSIFVNPLQFNRSDDLELYPRTLKMDCDKLESIGVDLLFYPDVDQIYPEGMENCTKVSVPQITDRLEGSGRPGHFVGVATVVSKLLNIVQPNVAVFGKKDLQQLLMIQKMARDLNLPIEIRAGETIREEDMVAMSSRNSRLGADLRPLAPMIYHTLNAAGSRVEQGEKDFRKIERDSVETLDGAGFRTEYVELCDTRTLLPANSETASVVILAAAWLGDVRLIDNIMIKGE